MSLTDYIFIITLFIILIIFILSIREGQKETADENGAKAQRRLPLLLALFFAACASLIYNMINGGNEIIASAIAVLGALDLLAKALVARRNGK